MRIGVIDKCALVTEEVWRRKNAYEAQPNTSRKLVATAELQPVRRRGEPLKRTRSGFEDADPGRKGMVYSWVEGDGGYSNDGSGTGSPDPMAEERFPRRPKPLPLNIGKMDPAYTVRGHLHWVGVMWDWGWEGKRKSTSVAFVEIREELTFVSQCFSVKVSTAYALLVLDYCLSLDSNF